MTVTIEQPGPIAFVKSTTSARVFEEDANRCIMLSTYQRRSQTETILKRLATYPSGKVRSERPRVVALHQTLQRLLERREIVIPFAERLADLFEAFTERVEYRRAFPMLLSLDSSIGTAASASTADRHGRSANVCPPLLDDSSIDCSPR